MIKEKYMHCSLSFMHCSLSFSYYCWIKYDPSERKTVIIIIGLIVLCTTFNMYYLFIYHLYRYKPSALQRSGWIRLTIIHRTEGIIYFHYHHHQCRHRHVVTIITFFNTTLVSGSCVRYSSEWIDEWIASSKGDIRWSNRGDGDDGWCECTQAAID